jgi:hypothetical protein
VNYLSLSETHLLLISTNKPIVAAISIIIGIIGIVLGLVAYSYTQIHVSLNDVSFHSIDWASFSWSTLLKLGLNLLTGNWLGAAFDLIDGINLNLIFGLSNYGVLPVYIPDLSYDLSINGISVGSGYSTIDTTINPGETREIPVLQNFQKSSLSPAVISIVDTGGIINLHVSGTAYFKLLGLTIPIPFESTKQISIVDEIKSRLNKEIQKNQQKQSKLDLQLSGETIVDSVYRVEPGTSTYVYFTLQCRATVQGGFSASAALGDDIIVYILDEDQFNLFDRGESTSTYYNSGKVGYDTFAVTLNPGTYYIVMSNTYSIFSTKTVELQAAGFCR